MSPTSAKEYPHSAAADADAIMIDQSSESGDDITSALKERLRSLASNMAAISRGNGEPGELVDQVVKVAESLILYNEAFGTRPEEELIRQALTHLRWAPNEEG